MPDMETKGDLLRRIDALPVPRHLFVLPNWVDPEALERLILEGYLMCTYEQRDARNSIQLIMGLELTRKGNRALNPQSTRPQFALRACVAGASFTVLSLLILYLA